MRLGTEGGAQGSRTALNEKGLSGVEWGRIELGQKEKVIMHIKN